MVHAYDSHTQDSRDEAVGSISTGLQYIDPNVAADCALRSDSSQLVVLGIIAGHRHCRRDGDLGEQD